MMGSDAWSVVVVSASGFGSQGSGIATDKRGYPHDIFLISPQKHMLWVLIRSASLRHF